MESLYLKNYLENVGNAIHSLNTICVGLSAVSSGKAAKPDDMVISWNPKDVFLSAKVSRIFAIKSAYVFLAESMYGYIDHAKNVLISDEEELNKFNSLKNAEKIDYIFKAHCDSEDRYRLVLLKLMIHARNRIVHKKSKAGISSNETDCLMDSSEMIHKNHSGLIVEELMKHFRDYEFTLKDVSSHAANSIYMMRCLDKSFASHANTKHQLLKMIEANELSGEWEAIVRHERNAVRKRKIENFIRNYFRFLEDEDIVKITTEID